jgi:protein-S-isoprenylcysteine O-methyltransferase Ste14
VANWLHDVYNPGETTMKQLTPRTLATSAIGLIVLGALLFVPAGTLGYWQAWLFIVVFSVSTQTIGIYLALKDPALLARRLQAGPAAEQRTSQRIIMVIGVPLALDSWFGLLVLLLTFPVLIWRILDEEKLLENELGGYRDYAQQVRYRLVPFIW